MKRSMLWVMVCNALVAIAAFLKDVLLASYVGTSAYADSFTLAYFVTDTIANNWLAASIGAAGVTVMAGIYKERPQSLITAWNYAMVNMLWVSIAIMLVCYAIVWITVSNVWFILIMSLMLPAIVVFALAGVCVAGLQAVERFGVSAAAPLMMHGAILSSTALAVNLKLPPLTGLVIISLSVTIGAVGTAGWVWATCKKTFPKRSVETDTGYDRTKQKRLMQLFAVYTLFIVSSQLGLFWERGLAAGLGTGVVTALNFAYRVANVPVWVFATAIGAVLLPRISYLLSLKKMEELKEKITGAVSLTVWMTLPASLLISFWSEPIVVVLFQRGAFDEHSVAITSGMLTGYGLAIAGYSLSAFLTRYWLADGRAKKAAFLMIVGTFITVYIQWMLARTFGPAGIGYGAAIGASVQAILFLYPIFRGEMIFGKRATWQATLQAALGVGVSLLISWTGMQLWESLVVQQAQPIKTIFVLLVLGVSFFSFCVVNRSRLLSLLRSVFAASNDL